MKRISLITRLRRKVAAAIRASQHYSSPFATDGQTARRRRRQAQRQQQLDEARARARAAQTASLY